MEIIMNQEYNTLSQLLGGALEAMATRPQKTYQKTSTLSSVLPYALEDILLNRNKIGASTKELDEVLKLKESPLYSFASTLAAAPQQQGHGSWLSAFARGLGGTLAGATNARVERAEKKAEQEVKDLERALEFDKAMGSTTRQTQEDVIGYTPMEYGSGKSSSGSGKGSGTQQQVPIIEANTWQMLIEKFDKDRPSESAYRNQSQALRNLQNRTLFMGDKEENYARELFATLKGKDFLPMARNALKGAGQISDFEDKKYTEWLNEVKDPVQLKDKYKLIIDDVAKNNKWNADQKTKAYELLGLSTFESELLPAQKKYEPERIKKEETSIQSILEKHGAKRVE